MKKIRTGIGGQALIEGIMMRGKKVSAICVRQPDGEIFTQVSPIKPNPVEKIPFVRGVVAFIRSIIDGYGAISKSSEIALGEDSEDEFDRKIKEKFGEKALSAVSFIAGVLGVLIAVALFIVVPTAVAKLIDGVVELGYWKAAVEGIVKIIVFIAYIALVGCIKDISRVFEYHGAEHKTIFCYEAGEELTVENVKKMSRLHPRCGTNFIFLVLIVSIISSSFITLDSVLYRTLFKLALLPVVMGISYEILKLLGKYDNLCSRIVAAPGLWLQKLTTREPDESEMEIAITALNAILPVEDERT